ncbi:MAG: Arc family DNA-binding protein [Oscillospiraceae bacterium]|nr:Arc family DNA-binding protein [Oscillospiraceae bacterium]
MPLSDARRESIEKYLGKLDDIKIRVPKGDRDKIKAHAQAKGMSLNAYILELVRGDMEGR